MRPLGLQLFAWVYGYRKIRGKWTETYEDRIVKRHNRGEAKRAAIKDRS